MTSNLYGLFCLYFSYVICYSIGPNLFHYYFILTLYAFVLSVGFTTRLNPGRATPKPRLKVKASWLLVVFQVEHVLSSTSDMFHMYHNVTDGRLIPRYHQVHRAVKLLRLKQESRVVVRKPRDAAAVVFGLKSVAALAIDKVGPRPYHFRSGPTSGPTTRSGFRKPKSKIFMVHSLAVLKGHPAMSV